MGLKVNLPFDVAWGIVSEWSFVSTETEKQKVHRLIGGVVDDIEKFVDVCEFVSTSIYEEEYDNKTGYVIDVHLKDSYDRTKHLQDLYREAVVRSYPDKYDLERIKRKDKEIEERKQEIQDRKYYYYLEKYLNQWESEYQLLNWDRYDRWRNSYWYYRSSWWAEQQY